MEIECYAVVIAMVLAMVFGHLYEIWPRQKVLCLSFALLGFAMFLPNLGLTTSQTLFGLSRILSCCLVQAIMQNPLLNDYIKKGNHGWAHAFQKLGFILGEALAFIIILFGMDGDQATQDLIFNCVAGGVLVIGLLVSLCMVKDRKV